MAPIRQIALKAAELNTVAQVLEDLLQRRAAVVAEAQDLTGRIAAQQAIVQGLRTELIALVNEP